MLELKSRHCFSRHYVATVNGSPVAELRKSAWRQRGEIRINERVLTVRAHGVMKHRYVLSEGDYSILELTQPSGWRSRVVFRFQDDEYEILNKPWYRSQQVIRRNAVQVGSIRFAGFLTSRLHVDLPDSLPREVQVFLGWYALTRRDEAAAAAG